MIPIMLPKSPGEAPDVKGHEWTFKTSKSPETGLPKSSPWRMAASLVPLIAGRRQPLCRMGVAGLMGAVFCFVKALGVRRATDALFSWEGLGMQSWQCLLVAAACLSAIVGIARVPWTLDVTKSRLSLDPGDFWGLASAGTTRVQFAVLAWEGTYPLGRSKGLGFCVSCSGLRKPGSLTQVVYAWCEWPQSAFALK